MAESIQLKLPFYFFDFFCSAQPAAAAAALKVGTSAVLLFSFVCTIYLNSIITDNLLANFKAKCA